MSAMPIWVVVTAGTAGAICFHLVAVTLLRAIPAYRVHFADSVSRQLAGVFLYVEPSRLLVVNGVLAAASAASAAALGGGIPGAALAALIAGALPRALLMQLRRRRVHAFRQQLSDLMMLTAAGLRAGLGLAQALGQTSAELDAPAKQEVELMLREQRLGASFDEALVGLERRMPLEETTLMCAALRISRRTGGNLAETLEALADGLRRKVAIEGKIRALTAQGRMQAWAMGLLPMLCAGLLIVVEPVAMRAMFTTWYGLAACAVVGVMQLLGMYFLRRVMRIDV